MKIVYIDSVVVGSGLSALNFVNQFRLLSNVKSFLFKEIKLIFFFF